MTGGQFLQQRQDKVHIQVMEITHQQHETARRQAVQQETQALFQAWLPGLEVQWRTGGRQRLQQGLQGRLTHGRREPVRLFIEDQSTHGQRLLPGLPGMEDNQLRRQGGLELVTGGEAHGGAPVRQQEDLRLAFLDEDLGEQRAAAGIEAPVQQARLVARLVGTVFLELEATPAPCREAVPDERMGRGTLEFQQPGRERFGLQAQGAQLPIAQQGPG